MRTLSKFIFVAIAAVLGAWGIRRRYGGDSAQSVDARTAKPVKVDLPEADEPEKPRKRRRTGETQALSRKVVHGPYRAIGDRGSPTNVASGETK